MTTFDHTMKHLGQGTDRDGTSLLKAMVEDLGNPPGIWAKRGPDRLLARFSEGDEAVVCKPLEDLHWWERSKVRAWHLIREAGVQGTELGTPYDLAYLDVELTRGNAVNLPSPRLTDVRERMLAALIGERADVMMRLRRDLVLFVTIWGAGYERAEVYVVGSASAGDSAGEAPGVHVKRLPFHRSSDTIDHDRHLQLVSGLDASRGPEAWRDAFEHSYDTLSAIRDHFRGKMRDALLELMKLLDARSELDARTTGELKRLRESGTLLVFRLMFLLEVERRGLLYEERVQHKPLAELMGDLASGDPDAVPGAIFERVRTLTLAIRNASDANVAVRGASIFSNRPNDGFDEGELTPWLDAFDTLDIEETPAGELARWDAALLQAGAVATGQVDAQVHLSNGRMGAGGVEHTHRILGDVYEQILAYVPDRNKKTDELILKLKGGKKDERSALGAHYTPPALVNEIVRPALGRLFAARWESSGGDVGGYVEELLDLKVCDPAMGSAHFLTVAALEIAREIAWARINKAPRPLEWHEPMLHPNPIGASPEGFDPHDRQDDSVFALLTDAVYGGEGEPGAFDREVQRWVPGVVQRCVYGVDVNPLACELGKLSLWLFTLTVQEDERPELTFLDGNIKCGNSLIGVSIKQAREILLDKLGVELPGDQGELLSGLGSIENLWRKINLYQHIMRLDEGRLRDRAGEFTLTVVKGLEPQTAYATALRRRFHEETVKNLGSLRWIYDLAVLLIFFKVKGGKTGCSDLVVALNGAGAMLPAGAKDPGHPIWSRLISEPMDTKDDVVERVRRAIARAARRLESSGVQHSALHWEVDFPAVFHGDEVGFDALVANPPFVGDRKLKGFAGERTLEYLKTMYTGGSVTDLCGFFFLRFDALVNSTGLISTLGPNTMAQAKNRREAILPMISGEEPRFNVVRARRSENWPGEAAVYICMILAARQRREDERFVRWSEREFIEGAADLPISSYLDEYPESFWRTLPSMSTGLVYQGVLLRGDFSLRSQQSTLVGAISSVPANERSSLFAYLNNQELQQQPRPVPSRVVIDFFDDLVAAGLDSLDRNFTTSSADQLSWLKANRPYLLNQLETVPAGSSADTVSHADYRKSLPPSNDNDPHREYWWRYGRPRIELRSRWQHLDFVTAFGRVSKVWSPSFLSMVEASTDLVICPTDAMNVSPNQSRAFFGTLTSFLFEAHMRREASTIKTDVRVTPTDSIPVFPMPWAPTWDNMEGRPTITNVPESVEMAIGGVVERVLEHRQAILDDPDGHGVEEASRTSRWGPTEVYNLYDDPECELEAIWTLRRLHQELLSVVLEQYGWLDEFGEIEWCFDVPWIDRTPRYVPVLPVRQRLFERLSELNAQRYDEEVAMYLTHIHPLMEQGKKYSFNMLRKALKEDGSGVNIGDDDLIAVLEMGRRRRKHERIVMNGKGKYTRPTG